MLNRIGGIYLIAIAVIVAVHTVAEPLYHFSDDGQMYSSIWSILNPLMALAIVLSIMVAWQCKRSVSKKDEEGPVSRAFLTANTLFFGLFFFGIMFFWNWFNLLSPGYVAIPKETVSLVWIIVDAALPLLWATTGVILFRGKASE